MCRIFWLPMLINPKFAIIAHDITAIFCAWALVLLTRFNFEIPPAHFVDASANAAPIVVLIQGVVNGYFGLYKGLWRFTSVPDLWNLFRSVSLGTFVIAISLFVLNRLEYIPRSTVVLYPLFLIVLLGGPRLFYRILKDRSVMALRHGIGKKVLVVGGGTAGEAVIREMLRESDFRPLGLVDDNQSMQGSRIHGVPVLGTVEKIPALTDVMEIELIIIAVPSASVVEMQKIVEICNSTGTPFRTLPKLNDIVEGRVALREVRAVSIDDLLGRDQVSLDWELIKSQLSRKRVLVTGGGGSIGRELCLQLYSLDPAKLTVLDQSEYNLYRLENELQYLDAEIDVDFVLGNVLDTVLLNHIFKRDRPQIVFHAAAYKHVPILEVQIREAIRNNIFGTKVLAEAAHEHSVESFVLISTDKAVRPSSTMGATKRVAELLCQRMNMLSDTKFITVRFGNVLNSAGSVVPLFKEQISRGGPVTVTHKDATRFFMSIPEACQLILEASSLGDEGDLFVLDMGEPIKITYLAEQMIKLSGHRPGEDIKLVFTGLRPGEKIAEELFFGEEKLLKTGHDKLLLSGLGPVDFDELGRTLTTLKSSIDVNNEYDMRQILGQFFGNGGV